VAYLRSAAEQDPNYVIPYTLRESVLTYLGRAYYEVGNFAEARTTLEKALSRDRDDHAARLYLGLALLRGGDQDRGRREVESGLKGIHDWLEYITSASSSGVYWDPGRQIRSEIQRALNGNPGGADFISAAQLVGSRLDEEIDRARRDEARDRYGRGGDS